MRKHTPFRFFLTVSKYFGTVILSFVLCGWLSGCGADNSTTEMPRSRNALLLRLFTNLQNNKLEEALQQIDKLQQDGNDSAFLLELEANVNANIQIQAAQAALNANDLPESLAILERARRKQPFSAPLEAAEKTLLELRRLQNNIGELERAENSAQLSAAIKVLDTLSIQYKPAAKLPEVLKLSAQRRDRWSKMEQKQLQFSLGADLYDAGSDSAALRDTLEALWRYHREVAAPSDIPLTPAEIAQLTAGRPDEP